MQKNSRIESINVTSGVQPFRAVNSLKYCFLMIFANKHRFLGGPGMLVEIWVLERKMLKHHDPYKKMSELQCQYQITQERHNIFNYM